MKKVIYIVKSELHIYPPCIAQIRMLKKNGVDVEVWYGSCAKQLLAIFDAENMLIFTNSVENCPENWIDSITGISLLLQ